ncbi:MAG: formate dehydrogenase accessory sulfurtransferase FdhD [Trueperaceae bacterium]|nr:formate dehydrogenase accessory sulfurtransferase FdhD [Trueperaceae bacterium]
MRHYGSPPSPSGGPAGGWSARRDAVVREEPLQLRLERTDGDLPLVTTMRTPGADFELAAGFLLAEGIVTRRDEILEMRYCRDVPAAERYNVLRLRLAASARVPDRDHLHHFTATAACGVCGKGQIASLVERGCAPLADEVRVPASLLAALPGRLRGQQPLFERTGALHAAGLFGPDGALLAAREDVGRHNALDKLFGWALLDGRLPLAGAIVFVSGRAGYELVQKCVVAGVAVFGAISAPSSLAIDVAREFGITLAAFVREGRVSVYAGAERVIDDLGRG